MPRWGGSEGLFISPTFDPGGRVKTGRIWPQDPTYKELESEALAPRFWVLPPEV